MIGLGGTGGKVIAATRRLMFQHHDSPEHKDIALNYLYLDTSSRETAMAKQGTGLADNDKRWRVLGRSVQLSPYQVVHLSNSSFGSVVNKIDDYTKISPWLGDTGIWQRYWNSQNGEMEAAGQVRRFGRAVLAQNIDKAARGLAETMRELKKKNNIARWRFHIVTGLAGGTGSGSFLDIIRLIRDATSGEDEAKIVLYAVLPEAEPTRWSNGSYHANGFAALAELNAMQVERLNLHNLQTGTINPLAPINAAWIITNQNNKGIRFDVDATLPNLIAETFYQTVVGSGDATIGADGPNANADERSWIDVPTGENLPHNLFAEKDDPTDPQMKPFDRANRFISFGIKRITVPSDEVKEYASLIFLRQFIQRSLYNNWDKANGGFADTNENLDHSAIAKSQDNLEKWLLTDKHLKLETGSMLNDNSRWRSIRDEFARAINGKVADILSVIKDSAAWPREIEEHARDFFEAKFRNAGVLQFYSGAQRSISDRAKLIVRDKVGTYLFAEWRAGCYSLNSCLKIAIELIAEIKSRRANCDEQIEKSVSKEAELNTAYAKMKSEYARLGFIGHQIYGKKRFSEISERLIDINTAKSQRAALGFMSALLAEVLVNLQELQDDLHKVKTLFDEALVDLNISIASRVEGDEVNTPGSGEFKFYEPTVVRDLLDKFRKNQTVQNRQSDALREKLVLTVGGKPTFRQFLNTATPGMIVASLEEISADQAAAELEAVETDQDRILGESIVQKLSEKYAHNQEGLETFLTHRVEEAQALIAIDNAEVQKTKTDWIRHTNVAFVPAKADQPEALRAFHARLTAALSTRGDGLVEIVETTGQSDQIVILSFVDRFPLRVLKNVGYLHGFYDKQIKAADGALAAMRLHVEGDGGALPPLYAAGGEEYRAMARPFWLIAVLRNLLLERPNPETGRDETLLKYMDGGKLRSVVVGTRIVDGSGKIGVSGAILLMKAVQEELAKLVHIDDRSALRVELEALRNDALEAAHLNESNLEFQRVDGDVSKAIALIPK